MGDQIAVQLKERDPHATVDTATKNAMVFMFLGLSSTGKTELSKASDDFRFAASVAEFGMILRDSKFNNGVNFREVLELSRASKGTDADGYRAEFIRLVETAKILFHETAGTDEKEK